MREGRGGSESKVTIVGAGPCGCFLAYLLEKNGIEVKVIEKKGIPWLPLKCAGLVSDRIKEIIKIPEEIILSECNVAILRFPGNREVVIKGKEKAFVIDRIKFDKFLFEVAEGEGAKFFLREDFKTFKLRNNCVAIFTGKRRINSKVLVGADGTLSKVRRNLNLKIRYVEGFQARVKMKHKLNEVELWFDKGIADFFSWIVPESENVSRAGVLCSRNSKLSLRKFLKKIKAKDIIDYQFGYIPSYFSKKMSGERIILVGDAASQAKASTGGGIVTGLLGSKIGSKCIVNAFEENCFSSKFFRENYDEAYYKEIGKELKRAYFLSRALREFNNSDLLSLRKLISNEGIQKIIRESGDMELYGKWLKPIFLELSFLKTSLIFILRHPTLLGLIHLLL